MPRARGVRYATSYRNGCGPPDNFSPAAIAIFAAHHMMTIILMNVHDGFKITVMAATSDPVVIRNSGQETP